MLPLDTQNSINARLFASAQARQDEGQKVGWHKKNYFKDKHKQLTSSDNGRTYQKIISGKTYDVEKWQHDYSTWTKVWRIGLGVLLVAITFGIGYWIKPINKLLTRTKESEYFAALLPAKPQIQPESLSLSESEQIQPKVSEVLLKFERKIDTWSFWDAYLGNYVKVLNDEKWNTPSGNLFLQEEFSAVCQELTQLNKEIDITLKDCEEKKKSGELDLVSYKEIINLKTLVDNKITEIQEILKDLQSKKFLKANSTTAYSIVGLRNDGNTCYINSALQPLLAIANFSDLVPEIVPHEPADTFEGRQKILTLFRVFLEKWKNKDRNPETLGKEIGKLRHCIFEVGLAQGGFFDRNQEKSFQDAGSFFELILHVLGKGFELKTTRAVSEKSGLDPEFFIPVVENDPQGVFYLKGVNSSVQKLVDEFKTPVNRTLSDAWRATNTLDNELMQVTEINETFEIVGSAPDILVVRVDNRKVDKCDFSIDFAPLLTKPLEDASYELVGFSQNHSQVHWTSVVKDVEEWKYCDDSMITPVQPGDGRFQLPASYMVYRKKSSIT